MRLTGASIGRMMILWALIGALPALAVSLLVPAEYEARVQMAVTLGDTVMPASGDRIATLEQRSFSNDRLLQIIDSYDLYRSQKTQSSIAAIEELKKGIQLRNRPGGDLEFSFHGTQAPAVVEQVTNELTSAMIEYNLKNGRKSGNPLRIVVTKPAMMPDEPSGPNRGAIFAIGPFAGALVGALLALVRRPPPRFAS